MKHFFSEHAISRLSDDDNHTGGMVALIPSAADAARIALPEWEAADQLHVTLAFLGGLVTTDTAKNELLELAGGIAAALSPIEANLWAAARFNPHGESPCSVYLVGGAGMDAAHSLTESALVGVELPEQHRPWVPHITIGYGVDVMRLEGFGTITFDRLRVAFADDDTDFPL